MSQCRAWGQKVLAMCDGGEEGRRKGGRKEEGRREGGEKKEEREREEAVERRGAGGLEGKEQGASIGLESWQCRQTPVLTCSPPVAVVLSHLSEDKIDPSCGTGPWAAGRWSGRTL